mgnify:CR=1 FL=1
MSLLGNILWIIFGGGIVICVEYLLAGVLLCCTIVGIPFGLQCFKLAFFAIAPFGKQVYRSRIPVSPLTPLLNIVWIVFAGIWIALTHILFAIGCAITIIGIPFAIQHMKIVDIGLAPFGREIA